MKGTFDGLTEKERDAIREMGNKAVKEYRQALRQYEKLFGKTQKGKN